MKLHFLFFCISMAMSVVSSYAHDRGGEYEEDIEIVDIEKLPIKNYNKVDYDGEDYSNTLVADYCYQLTKPSSYFPNGKIVVNPVYRKSDSILKVFKEGTKQCIRTVYVESFKDIVEITNLIPNVLYRYEFWGIDLNLIATGLFYTIGKTRMIKIPAVERLETGQYNHGYGYIYNVRDIGGLKTEDGRIIRYGRIIRGSALMRSDGSTYLSDDGINELKQLGVSAELDLRRCSLQTSALGNDVDYISLPIDQWFYRLNIFHNQKNKVKAFASAIRYIIKQLRKGGCVYVHCVGGADRTGALCTIIEGLCGVTENEICHDYEMTSFWALRKRNREYYSIVNGAKYDGDYKFAMSFIKGLIEYKGKIYIKYGDAYYDTDEQVVNYIPQPIDDSDLIKSLEAIPQISLKDRFRLLMQIGGNGLSISEMDELEDLLLLAPPSTPTQITRSKKNKSTHSLYDISGCLFNRPSPSKNMYIQNGKIVVK